jgi:DNA-binding SARP family transcriptional activator
MAGMGSAWEPCGEAATHRDEWVRGISWMERFEEEFVICFEIRLLGPFSTFLDGVLVTEFESDSARAPLACLAVERLRKHLAGVLRSLAAHHERVGEWDRAILAVERLVEADPWDER